MPRPLISRILLPVLHGLILILSLSVVWGLVEEPSARELAEQAGTLVILLWLVSVAWLLRRRRSTDRLFRDAEPPPPCWTGGHVLLAFLMFVLIPSALVLGARLSNTGGVLAAQNASGVLIVCLILMMIRRRGHDPADALGLRFLDGRVRDGLLAFIAALPGLVTVSYLWSLFVVRLVGEGVDLRQDIVKVFAETESPSVRVQVFVAAVLIAPIIEELLFRGLLYGYLRRRVRPVLAMIAVGVLFGAVHNSPVSLLPLSLLGIVMCYLYEKTGLLTVPILAHLLFNLVMLILMMLVT